MNYRPIPLEFERLSSSEQERRLNEFASRMNTRRTVRSFSDEPVPRSLIEDAVRVAGQAPSGANLQPWHFVVVENQDVKRRIREAAEREERENYGHRFPPEWLQRLSVLGTDADKPYLERAPFLIVVFKIEYGVERQSDGSEKKTKHYYVNESVGLAAGFLIAALHIAGLATLTHTPSPMGFLNEILGMPKNMKAVLLIPVGYPAPGAQVPSIEKKPLGEILTVL